MHVLELCKLHVGQEVASCRWTATSCKVAPSDNTAQCMYLLYVSAVCICCMYLLYVSAVCICCMYLLYVSADTS